MGIYLMNILNEAKKNASLCDSPGGYRGKMKKEIGGYFQLEGLQGTEYYPDLYRVNLGRTALLWLYRQRDTKRLFYLFSVCICHRNL